MIVLSIALTLFSQRNTLIDLFISMARYRGHDPEVTQVTQRFFEESLPYTQEPANANSYNDMDADNLRFIVDELFLYFIAVYLKHERFGQVGEILRHRYFFPSRYGEEVTQSFVAFCSHLPSLEERNKRLQLRRRSIKADLLKQRCSGIPISFHHLAQADFVLYLRSRFDATRSEKSSWQEWWPDTLLYVSNYQSAFEMFARAESKNLLRENCAGI